MKERGYTQRLKTKDNARKYCCSKEKKSVTEVS